MSAQRSYEIMSITQRMHNIEDRMHIIESLLSNLVKNIDNNRKRKTAEDVDDALAMFFEDKKRESSPKPNI